MPRTRSRISASAGLGLLVGLGDHLAAALGVVGRASPWPRRGWRPGRRAAAGRRRGGRARCAGARPRRCRRRRVRLVSSRVTWAGVDRLGVGPEQRPGQPQLDARPKPIVIHGATSTRPTSPTSAAASAPPPAVTSKNQNLAESPGRASTYTGSSSIASEPHHAAMTRAKPTVSTTRRAAWWPISFQRGPRARPAPTAGPTTTAGRAAGSDRRSRRPSAPPSATARPGRAPGTTRT